MVAKIQHLKDIQKKRKSRTNPRGRLSATFIESLSRNDKIQAIQNGANEETRPKAILMNKDDEVCAVCIRSGRKKLIEDIVKMIQKTFQKTPASRSTSWRLPTCPESMSPLFPQYPGVTRTAPCVSGVTGLWPSCRGHTCPRTCPRG